MTAAFSSPAAARHQNRKIGVGVFEAIADAAAVKDGHVIEQRTVAVRSRFEFLKKIGDLVHVVGVDLHHFFDRIGTGFVRQCVMRVADADFGIGRGLISREIMNVSPGSGPPETQWPAGRT